MEQPQVMEQGRALGRPNGRWAVPLIGVAVVAVALATQVVWDLPLSVEVRTVNLGLLDVVTVILLVIGLAGRPWRTLQGAARILVAAFALMISVGVLMWVLQIGLQPGVNQWRMWLLAVAFLLVATTFTPQRWSSIRSLLVLTAGAVAVFQLFALFVLGWAWGASERSGSGPGFYGARPIAASLALLLVVGFCLVVTEKARWGGWRVAGALLLGGSAVLSQHRTVWVSLIVAIPLLAWSLHRSSRDRGAQVALAGVGAFLVLAVALPITTGFSILPGGSGGSEVSAEAGSGGSESGSGGSESGSGGSESGSAVETAGTSTGTLTWRLDMWQSRVEADRSPTQWAVGSVLGPTPVNAADSRVMNPGISAHSMPVELLTMLGALGLLVVAGLWVLALRASYPVDAGLWVSLCALAAYGIFYQWPPWSWLLIGAGLVAATTGLVTSSGGASEAQSPVQDPGRRD